MLVWASLKLSQNRTLNKMGKIIPDLWISRTFTQVKNDSWGTAWIHGGDMVCSNFHHEHFSERHWWANSHNIVPQLTTQGTDHRAQGKSSGVWNYILVWNIINPWSPGADCHESTLLRSRQGSKEWHFMTLIHCCSPLTLTEQCKRCSELCNPKALEISVWFDTHILLKALIREWEATSWPQEAQRNGRQKPDMALSTQTSNSQSTFFFGPIYSCFFFL